MSKKPSELIGDIQHGLDKALAEHLVLTQGQLGKDNPKDTGRMSSSWFIGHNQPDRSVRPENWGTPAKRDSKGKILVEGSKTYEQPEYTGRITYDGTWYISNNLPYAERVCYDPKWAKGGAGGVDWFTRIANQQVNKLNERIRKHVPR